jgi:hypothetical protein
MIEIPVKNATAYRSLFQGLEKAAVNYNDKPGVDLDPSPDVVVLEGASKAMYGGGDRFSLQAKLQGDRLLSVLHEVESEREASKTRVELTTTADGLAVKESYHGKRGLTERSFLVPSEGEALLNLQETKTPGAFASLSKDVRAKMEREVGQIASGLPYLIR